MNFGYYFTVHLQVIHLFMFITTNLRTDVRATKKGIRQRKVVLCLHKMIDCLKISSPVKIFGPEGTLPLDVHILPKQSVVSVR